MSSRNNPARVAIVMGSKSDWATMQFAAEIFEILDVPHHVEVVSAHRTPDKLFSFAETAEENGYQVIIAGAGGAAHLPAPRRFWRNTTRNCISALPTGAKRKPMKFWKIPIRGGRYEASLRSRQRTTGPNAAPGGRQSLPPCRYSRASLPQRLSAGRKPRLPASWRATRPSSIAMYFRSSPTV